MDELPFAFCQSVVSLLSFRGFGFRKADRLSSTSWQTAIDALLRDRINVCYYIGYNGGVWSYCIWIRANKHRYHHITFEELQKLNRRNLRIRRVRITSDTQRHQASIGDVASLFKFTLPFVNMTNVRVHETKDFPQEDLLNLLSSLSIGSIESLFAFENSEEVWSVLSVHLNSESLRRLTVWDQDLSTVQRFALKEYVLHSRFSYFNCDSTEFLDMEMFEYLFNKPQSTHSLEIDCYSPIQLEHLRDFEIHLQIASSEAEITWQRLDLVVAPGPSACWIQFGQ